MDHCLEGTADVKDVLKLPEITRRFAKSGNKLIELKRFSSHIMTNGIIGKVKKKNPVRSSSFERREAPSFRLNNKKKLKKTARIITSSHFRLNEIVSQTRTS